VDSLGETLDSADLVIDSDSVITVNGAVNAIDWSFDRQLINDFGQPVLQQLEANWNGNQKFKILKITEDELWLYFDDVIPVTIAGFTADMELRHTQYWQR
jgi:predicted component of type VI protein secretion system